MYAGFCDRFGNCVATVACAAALTPRDVSKQKCVDEPAGRPEKQAEQLALCGFGRMHQLHQSPRLFRLAGKAAPVGSCQRQNFTLACST